MTRQVTLGEAVNGAARRLTAAGIEGARLDARLIVGRATGLAAAALLARSETLATSEQIRRIEDMVARRERREPMAHILGEREFWSLAFRVTPDTLVPRPDTETLVQGALDWAGVRGEPSSVLDLGTGTGCILLSLLSEWPGAQGVGVDISAAALHVARENAERLGLAARARFVAGDWGAGLEGPFDVIVTNPPYVVEGDLAGLEPEVAEFDPHLALSGGVDGLSAYREIAPVIRALLAPEGAAFLEIGRGQETEIFRMLEGAGLRVFDALKDLAGVTRCLVACG